MKRYLLMKHTLKENYKYFFSLLIVYAFMVVIYHVTLNPQSRDFVIQFIVYGLTILNALVLPNILYKNYYHPSNVNHMASIPFKRSEIFFCGYFVGLMVSVMMIMGYTLTTSMVKDVAMFMPCASSLLFAFIYYYHLSMLGFWLCGQRSFQVVLLGVLILGPYLSYMVFQWTLEMNNNTYVMTTTIETLFKLVPFIGCIYPCYVGSSPIVYDFYMIEATLLLGLSFLAMRYRPYESTGQSVVYKKLSIVIRGIVIVLSSSCLYAINGLILSTTDYVGQLLASLISSVMIAYIVEMIYKKKAKVFYSVFSGLLVGVLLFVGVRVGVKVMEDYVPLQYGHIYVEASNYEYESYVDYMEVKDPQLLVSLHKDMMDYYKYHLDDIESNQHFGYITIYYAKKGNENAFYARRYSYTQELQDKVLSKPEYRPLMYNFLTFELQELVNKARNKERIVFIVNDNEYVLDTEQEFYLFENFMMQELIAVYESDENIFDLVYSEDQLISWETEDQAEWTQGYQRSDLLYRALSKTFGF